MTKTMGLCFITVILFGCSKQVESPLPIRAIKTVVVEQRAGQQERRIAGITEADIVTELATQVGGRLLEINVNMGDKVHTGDIIAQIDSEPYVLKVKSAEGQLAESMARYGDTRSKMEQMQSVYEKGYASKADYDTAVANFNNAKSTVEISHSQLSLAQRDLQSTTLTSPLNGQITTKYVDQFAEVAPGQQIVQISAEGQLKVKANVPEQLIDHLRIGDPVRIVFSTLSKPREGPKTVPGKISEISARAGSGSAFPVTAVLDKPDPQIRPGISAEVIFAYSTAATNNAFVLPLTALLPTANDHEATIFVFDPDASVVRKRNIEVLDIHNNELEVSGDIQTGDIVAVAGVSFLNDGMEVKLLEPAQASGGNSLR